LFSAVTANAASKVLPVLNRPIADQSGSAGVPISINLNDTFGTEAIDDQVVRFTSQFNTGGVPVVMDMALFSNRTPVTRQNFLKYVTDGDYVNSVIHRSVPGFVIQGGGFRFNGTSFPSVPADVPIVNEFGISNTPGTISMAKAGGDPNSATSQWFVSLGANSDNLDSQNGGFTVFGRMTRSTFGNAQTFGNPDVFPIFDVSGTYGGDFTSLPLLPPDNNLILFPGVALVPIPVGEAGEDTTLAFSIVSNSNPAVATAVILPGGILNLAPLAGQAGSPVITIRATDSVGNTVDDSLILSVNLTDTYATWASRGSFSNNLSAASDNPDGDAWNNLQEFAFFGTPSISDTADLRVFGGTTGGAPAFRYLTLTFPVRKNTLGLTYFVEATATLSGVWTEIWNSGNGFSHARVVSAVDQADRTVVTIKDTVDIGIQSHRFLRIKVVQQ
jgi:peptidyl-prolyl cis-trans isomerase A (cyclophilin A)